jgi:ESF2/ABP1 family protein
MHTARLRLELSQSRSEQREYLKNVELARVLDKREERSQAAGKKFKRKEVNKRPASESSGSRKSELKRPRTTNETSTGTLESVLGSIF